MPKVKALRDHMNNYGDKPAKAKGDEYVIASESQADALVQTGFVELAGDKAAKPDK
jgi:hypothetical protein